MYELTPAQLTPRELPEAIGQRYLFTMKADLLDFYDAFEDWDTHTLILMMDLDRTYVVDVELNPPDHNDHKGSSAEYAQ